MNILNSEKRRHGCTRCHDTATVVIVATPYGPLALTADALRAASTLARTLDPRPTVDPSSPNDFASHDISNLVDATEAGRLLSVKPTWLLQRAREGRIPHVKVGRYTRFDVTALRISLAREAPA